MIVSQRSKKIRVVNILSMMSGQPKIESTLDQKPSIFLFFKKTKGGIDTVDGMVRSYSTKRMTRRWPLVLLYNKINVSAINAVIIWHGTDHENSNICRRQRRQFLINLGKELCGVTEEAYPVAPILQTEMGMLLLLEMVLY